MIVPPSYRSIPAPQDAVIMPIIVGAGRSIHPTSRRSDSISFLLPIVITAVFLLILAMTGLLARCLYRRFKALHVSPSRSSTSQKTYYSTLSGPANSHDNISHIHYDDDDLDGDEQARLLARRRSTSYYDANRSRAPVAVVIQHDAKGRPISTWSTASSVAAQRGEELSQWSRRRDDLIKIYGKNNLNSSSFAENEDLEEEPEQEEQEEQEEEQEGQELSQGQWQETVRQAGELSNDHSHETPEDADSNEQPRNGAPVKR
ncbi:hypothetical protein EDD21DRAFT_368985 [Dissophora ornata]|nr:hypothetical protein EDD21DRAFT_368985 [Dissophora ornata]